MNGISIPRILLPKVEDMKDWSVIACDQFTSDEKYWAQLEEEVGDKPSSLRVIYPEIYLKDNSKKRIADIQEKMKEYLSSGVFSQLSSGFILTERTTAYNPNPRFGIMISVDLEAYDYSKQSKSLIRATEATVPERLPPRVAIRKGACIELPHIMLLYNDEKFSVLGDLIEHREELKKLYDFELNQKGGHLKGYFIPEHIAKIIESRFYSQQEDGLLFAVGDGNHSLAAAKVCWEEQKEKLSVKDRENSPARYALVEAVNLYDETLKFEPIHRVVKNVSVENFIAGITACRQQDWLIDKNTVCFIGEDVVSAIRQADTYIADYISNYGGEVDYIHGEKELEELCKKENTVGIKLTALSKEGFFKRIATNGSLPRKTFSMGEGSEKRYYTEAKEI